MMNPTDLDASYKKYTEDLSQWLPDGVIDVDLDLLNSLGVLDKKGNICPPVPEDHKDHSFYIFESDDKITLMNDKYAVWIVPQQDQTLATTFTFVAKNTDTEPNLELVFSASGLYNSSAFILKILEAFLDEIEENENFLSSF
jgi:hypothetical protein